ncbi:SulP family inorganic anion transporter [Algicola sagamiensis]|uniref:SulP family inorganic anion transporter n=1 Tax=Algicola sagamiensis TaxID=163869 RepID=UPI0003A6F779|nr:SulP family inorganic anion transporter [Algicola sagamiensis]
MQKIFNSFSFHHLRGDLWGGATAAIISLPMALTFGVASGAGAEAGLYGAILVGLFASLFGGTPTLISEPTGPMTVMMTAVIASLIATNPESGMAMAFTVVILAGFFQMLFGFLKLGRYITLIPQSVISGFMSGIGIILVILQIGPILGQPPQPGGVMGTLNALPDFVSNINFYECGIALAALSILFFYPNRWKRFLPPQLVALLLITVLVSLFLGDVDIRRVGMIDVSFPVPSFPIFTQEQMVLMLVDGMVLGMLGCIDSMLTSVIADNLTKTEHQSDKELVGQGIGNMVSGLFGGLPGAGATMGTVVNIQAGGRTHLSGVIRAVVLIIAVFGFAGLLQYIPLALLAAIAVKVGLDILDWSFIKRAHKVSWQSALVMYSVIGLTVFIDLIVAVGVGVFVANIMIIEKLSMAQQEEIKAINALDESAPLTDKERDCLSLFSGKPLLIDLNGPMIFGVAKALARHLKQISNYDLIIFDLEGVSMLDDTMSLTIENAIQQVQQANKHVVVVIQNEHLLQKFQRMGSFEQFQKQVIFSSREDALNYVASICQKQ